MIQEAGKRVKRVVVSLFRLQNAHNPVRGTDEESWTTVACCCCCQTGKGNRILAACARERGSQFNEFSMRPRCDLLFFYFVAAPSSENNSFLSSRPRNSLFCTCSCSVMIVFPSIFTFPQKAGKVVLGFAAKSKEGG